MGLIVTAGSVAVETNIGPGRARVDFYRGQILPDDLTEEDRGRLLHLGQAAEAPSDVEEELATVTPVTDPDAVPAGTIEIVMEWVGADKVRAQRALDAEKAEGAQHRSTLIAKLEALLAGEA